MAQAFCGRQGCHCAILNSLEIRDRGNGETVLPHNARNFFLMKDKGFPTRQDIFVVPVWTNRLAHNLPSSFALEQSSESTVRIQYVNAKLTNHYLLT